MKTEPRPFVRGTASFESCAGSVDPRASYLVAGRLFASLELDATLDAVCEVFVPRWADGLSLSVDDERGLNSTRAAGTEPGPPAELTFALASDGRPFGTLRLVLRPGLSTEQRDAVERTVRLAEQAIANARRFSHERNVALTFQAAALDTKFPAVPNFAFDAIYRAGRAEALIGGDWYDAFQLRDGRIVVSIGDVVGSGLDAAIAMMNVRQAIRGAAQVHPDPALMLEAADETLRAQHPDRYVTAFVGVIDPVTQQCAYANAGHPPPFLRLADGVVVQAGGRAMPIGLGFQQIIDVHHLTLAPGTLMVLYTDGLTEATKDIAEGERRLEGVLREPDLPLSSQVAKRIHDGVVGLHARDDIAILVVTIGRAEPLRRWRFDPIWPDVARRARAELLDELARNDVGRERLLDVELVFSELMANLIRYAPGTAELILERQAGGFILHVLDKGGGFEVSPRLPADLFSQNGRGLFLIGHLSTEFNVDRRPGGGSHARIVLTR